MAEEKEKKPSPWEPVLILVGLVVGLFALWFVSGGPERGTLQEIFMSSPSSPSVPGVPGTNYDEYRTEFDPPAQ